MRTEGTHRPCPSAPASLRRPRAPAPGGCAHAPGPRCLFALAAAVVVVVASSTACAGAQKKKIKLPQVDPGQVLIDKLETRLMRARTVHIVASSTASGAVNAALDSELFLGEGQRARLDVHGTFEGRPVTTWFVCDGESMQVRGRGAVPSAPEVRDALVIGLVRMGLLHNAALLVGGAAPDHAAGGVRGWVKAERPRSREPATDIAYDVVVKHDVLGEAVLSLSAEEEPVARTAEMHFEEGDMKSTEKFTVVELDAPVDDAVFSLAP